METATQNRVEQSERSPEPEGVQAPAVPVSDCAGAPSITPGANLGAYFYYVGADPIRATWWFKLNGDSNGKEALKVRIKVWGAGHIESPIQNLTGYQLESEGSLKDILKQPEPNTVVLRSQINTQVDGFSFTLDPEVTTLRVIVLDGSEPMDTSDIFLGSSPDNHPSANPFKVKLAS